MTDTAKLYGAIEGGGTKFVCAVGHADGAVLAQTRLPTTDADETLGKVVAFLHAQRIARGPLAGIGMACFGPLDLRPQSAGFGHLGAASKTGWSGADLQAPFAALDAPLRLETDVNGAGLAEARWGAGRGLDTIAYVTVGTGIGVGIIHKGQPRGGHGHYEIGHIGCPHDRRADPFAGVCGYHGDCLEGLASGPAILARWGHSLEGLPPDHLAIGLEADYLGFLCQLLFYTHAPQRIIMGGGVMHTPGLMAQVRARTWTRLGGFGAGPQTQAQLEDMIVAPGLGDQAGIRGALALASMASG